MNLVDVESNTSFEQPKEPWKFISEQIKRSKIKRFKWESIFGQTLTKEILTHKMQHKTADETVHLMINYNTIVQLAKTNPNFCRELCRKIKISVYARFGENNSSLKLYAQLNHGGKKMNIVEQKLTNEVRHWEAQMKKYAEWKDNAAAKLTEAETVLDAYAKEKRENKK